MGRKKKAASKKKQVDSDSDSNTSDSDREEQVDSDHSDSSDSEEETPKASSVSRVVVEYCPVCTFPFEYCEYAGQIDKCKPHLMEWMKRQAGATGECDVTAEIDELSIEDKVKPKKKNPEGVEKMLPGGKVRKKEESCVLITVNTRQKRKCVTTVTGLELFGVKLADAAKEFKKMFSCGASVVKTPSGKEQIDIQGPFRDQLLEMWMKKPILKEIPKDVVFTMDEGKNKVAAFA